VLKNRRGTAISVLVVGPDPRVSGRPRSIGRNKRCRAARGWVITEPLFFDLDTGEIVIEGEKTGLVIGRHGATLREITKQIGWTPRVVRTPPIESFTVKEIPSTYALSATSAKSFLKRWAERFTGRSPRKTNGYGRLLLADVREVVEPLLCSRRLNRGY